MAEYEWNLNKNSDTPPFTPHYDIFWGELNISSWISTAQKEESYNFEILHVVLSYQKKKIATLKQFWYPPFTPHYDIFGGELNISSWISTAQKEKSYNFEILHVVLSYQKNMIGTLKKNLIPPFHPSLWYKGCCKKNLVFQIL